MLVFSPEEQYSYLTSIDNLITLKMLHDYGIDVSKFVDFMMDVSYGNDMTVDLLKEGVEELFEHLEEFTPYDFDEECEDECAKRDNLIEMGFGPSLEAELYYICSSSKLTALMKHPIYQEKILCLFNSDNIYNFHCMFYEGDIYIHKQTGEIGMSFEFVGELSDIFETLLRFLTFIEQFHQEMEGENL